MNVLEIFFRIAPACVVIFAIYWWLFKADFLLPITSEELDEIIEKYPDYLNYLRRSSFESLKYNAKESRFYGFLNPKLTFYEFLKKEKKTSAKSERNEK